MTVTPTGVREGDPAALTALCAARGPSVVAYCRQVAGEAEAGNAAADAFARFRVGVVAAGDTTTLNPEALLISATRTSAAAFANASAQGDCADVPMLLATRAERTIAPQDLERLESHLASCWACRAPVARFKSAERAYRDPPEKDVGPALSEQIVAALVAAVPPPPLPTATAADNGAAAHPGVAPAGNHPAPASSVEQPTEDFTAPGMIEPGAGAEADAAPPRRRRERRRAGSAVSLSRLRPSRAERGPREQPHSPPPPAPSAPRAARERSDRSRPGLRLGVVLPIVLILLALLGALYVAGVFGGSDPESSSRTSVPASAPGATTTPALVAVPGAKSASAHAVEVAKARERARERGDAPPATTHKAAAKTAAAKPASVPAATAPPPAPVAAAPPPPAATARNPAPPPAPKRDTSSSAPKRIDAGNGATGAEQIPPAADATNVPELAPPAEPPATP